jgi:hypothetical protein
MISSVYSGVPTLTFTRFHREAGSGSLKSLDDTLFKYRLGRKLFQARAQAKAPAIEDKTVYRRKAFGHFFLSDFCDCVRLMEAKHARCQPQKRAQLI